MKKSTRRKTDSRPVLVQVGNHLININDVSSISRVRRGLYIVKFMSNPNPEYATWVSTKNIEPLLKYFNVLDSGVKIEEDKREEPDFDPDPFLD